MLLLDLGSVHHIVWVGCWMSWRKMRGHLSTCGLLSPSALTAPPLGQLRAWEGRDKTGAEKGLRAEQLEKGVGSASPPEL